MFIYSVREGGGFNRWLRIERNFPSGEVCNYFFTMIETPSPQWGIGFDSFEGLNLSKSGDLLLYEVLPDKMTSNPY